MNIPIYSKSERFHKLQDIKILRKQMGIKLYPENYDIL